MIQRPALPRSLLYVPATHPEWVAKGWAAGADAVILDLEDAVVEESRAQAAAAAEEAVAAHARLGGVRQLWVRVNPRTAREDLGVAVREGLTGVVVPKAEPELLAGIARDLDMFESERGLDRGSTRVLATIETARGVLRAEQVALAPRVTWLGLGEADLAGELRIDMEDRHLLLTPARFAVVVASAAAGLPAPVGPVHTLVNDVDGLTRTCREQRRQGFRARTAIHPTHVTAINGTFTPSEEELAAARELVAAYEAGVAAGQGAVRGPDGAFLDRATVRQAHETILRSSGSAS